MGQVGYGISKSGEDQSKFGILTDTNTAMDAWYTIKDDQVIKNLIPMPLDTPIHPDKVRFVCISDTHSNGKSLEEIPEGDVFIHAGDFTCIGKVQEVEDFNHFLGTLPHRHKIVIAGNHELTFDEKFFSMTGPLKSNSHLSKETMENCRIALEKKNKSKMSDLLTKCLYLQDSETVVYGLRIYGSPWQPEFHSWAFNCKRGEDIMKKWNKIPEGIDVLVTHGPPLGRGDICVSERHEGCADLLSTIQQRVRPKFHIFGHIHEGRDLDLNPDEGYSSDGVTTYINASLLDRSYKAKYPPVIFDIPLPPGMTKEC